MKVNKNLHKCNIYFGGNVFFAYIRDMDIYQKETPKIYIVIVGIFKGHIFKGMECFVNDSIRILDMDSFGRSFPLENCQTHITQ